MDYLINTFSGLLNMAEEHLIDIIKEDREFKEEIEKLINKIKNLSQAVVEGRELANEITKEVKAIEKKIPALKKQIALEAISIEDKLKQMRAELTELPRPLEEETTDIVSHLYRNEYLSFSEQLLNSDNYPTFSFYDLFADWGGYHASPAIHAALFLTEAAIMHSMSNQ